MREIEAAKKLAIVLDTVGVVVIVIEQKTQKIGLAGLDHTFELVCRVRGVASELRLPDRKLVALLDLEDQIEALFPRDRLWIDPDFEIAVLAIEFDDLRDVIMHEGVRKRSPGARLHDFLQIIVLDPLVAFERNFVDRRTLDDRDQDTVAVAGNLHVLEKAGGIEALERRVEGGGVDAAGVRRENGSGSSPHRCVDCRRPRSRGPRAAPLPRVEKHRA